MKNSSHRFPSSLILAAAPFLPLLSSEAGGRLLGIFAFGAYCIFLAIKLAQRANSPELAWPAGGILLLLISGIFLPISTNSQTLTQIFQLIVVQLTLKIFPTIRIASLTRSIALPIVTLISTLALLDLYGSRGIFFSNLNGYGLAGISWFFLTIALIGNTKFNKRKIVLYSALLPSTLLIVSSDSRSSILAAATTIIWIAIVHPSFKMRYRNIAVFAILFLPLTISVFLLTSESQDMLEYIPAIGGKSPFSGRDIIWTSIVVELASRSYIGFGIGTLPGGILQGNYQGLSAHNGFLQIFYQFGAPGLVLISLVCLSCAHRLNKRDDHGISVGIFIGALLHEMFEVVLFQNHFGAGLMIWSVTAIRQKRGSV